MGRVNVEGFEHTQGVHCGSTAMLDVLGHAGIELTEAMVYGLGSGAAFTYLKQGDVSPQRIIAGRPERLEQQAADSLGLVLEEHRTDDEERAWEEVAETIADDRPVIVQCDLSKLPYWESSTPFNGHRIVVVGYEQGDDPGRSVWVADTGFEGLQEIDWATLHSARASQAPPSGGNQFAWWSLASGDPESIEEAIGKAIRRNCRQMEGEYTEEAVVEQTLEWEGDTIGGLDGLREFADEVSEWESLSDAVWCYRFAYQCIEKRGTGGAMFRNLYHSFLRESSEHDTGIDTTSLAHSMSRVAEAWSTLATYLDATATFLETDGEQPGEDPRHHLETMAEAVMQFESTFWDRTGMVV